MEAPVLYAFLLTLGAGLATGIGSAIAFFANHTNRKFLSFSLGVSAGVMIYVSFVEILHGAQISLEEILGVRGGMSVCALAFFGGMLLSALIDRVVPSAENPHEFKSVENMDAPAPPRHRMMRTGLLTALVVGIHNFPEGIATFMGFGRFDRDRSRYRRRHSDSQHSGRDRRLCPRLLCDRQPQEGVLVLVSVGNIRAGRRVGGLPRADAFHVSRAAELRVRRRRRHHGLHFAGRAAACRAGVRPASYSDLRLVERHGRDGPQFDSAVLRKSRHRRISALPSRGGNGRCSDFRREAEPCDRRSDTGFPIGSRQGRLARGCNGADLYAARC